MIYFPDFLVRFPAVALAAFFAVFFGATDFLAELVAKCSLHFGGKLTIRHFVSRFQFYGDATKFLGLDVLAELALGFTRTKDQTASLHLESKQLRHHSSLCGRSRPFALACPPQQSHCGVYVCFDLEPPADRTGCPISNAIFLISWPASVIRTTMACLWSIQTPAFVAIACAFLHLNRLFR